MAVPPPRPTRPPSVDKTTLRRELRARRRAFTDEAGPQRLAAFHRDLVLRLAPHLAEATIVSAYVATGGEIDPLEILLHAADMGVRTALPRVVSRDEPMSFRYWMPGDELVGGV